MNFSNCDGNAANSNDENVQVAEIETNNVDQLEHKSAPQQYDAQGIMQLNNIFIIQKSPASGG